MMKIFYKYILNTLRAGVRHIRTSILA